MAAKQTSVVAFTEEEINYADLVVQILSPVIPGLARALEPRTEVLLHDLTKFPQSIVAIAGALTGRTVGGPPTDLGMKVLTGDSAQKDMIGYRTTFGSGLDLKSSSLFFQAPSSGRTVVALCINADVTAIVRAQEALAALGFPLSSRTPSGSEEGPRETFPESVDTLAQGILSEAIASSGVSVPLMKKSHKIEVVRELDDRGFFTLREAVDLVAKSLEVSRYSIYNYLNEIQAKEEEPRNAENK